MSTPKVLSRKANGTAAQLINDAPKAPRTKLPPQGEKVVVRRLPPQLTEEEFIAILGDTWKLGGGKIDWFSYWPGKTSQQASKPSKPSRAYLHVKKRDDLLALSDVVRTAEWQDAKGSFTDPILALPPTVEFSIYKKVPSDNKRSDGRQGTIDQDPEFMEFLESLANPDAHKDSESPDKDADEGGKAEKPTTTPLIEHLREKAARAKEAAAARNGKHSRHDSQGAKGKAPAAGTEEPKKKGRDGREGRDREGRDGREGREPRESRAERAERASEKAAGKTVEKPKEPVRILSKKAAADAAADAAKTVANQIQASAQTSARSSAQASSSEAPTRTRRAGIAAAARILQRDLGLSPGNAHRKARQEAAKTDPEEKVTPKEPAVKATPKESVKEPVPSAKVSAPSSSADPNKSTASTSSTISTKGQAPAAPASSAASSSRRGRNRQRGAGTAEEPAKSRSDNKSEGKATEPASQAPLKTPVILKKRDDKKEEKKETPSAAPAPSPSPAPSTASLGPAPPAGPKAASTRQQASSRKAAGNAPSQGATRAFVKHASHSQGVTEALLREALQVYGPVTSIDIDRKKGFAYADFAKHEGLAKAMAAGPIAVAQATVQVLERKDLGAKKAVVAGDKGRAAAPSPAAETAPAPASLAPAAGPSADKSAASQDKHRSGRRRGGRGRGEGGGKDGKENGSGKGAEGGAQASTSTAAA